MSSSNNSSTHPSPVPLEERDIPVGTPLDARIVDADGRLLLDRGAVLPGILDRTALCRYFRPHRDADGHPDATSARPAASSADRGVPREDMQLKIDTRLGVRLPLGTGKLTYASRILGMAPHGAMFIAPPTLGRERLVVASGEQVELVAVGARALFLFPSTVEAVCVRPFPYLVLSSPGFIRRVRERRAVRVPTRLAVLFRSEADVEGLGVALDINMLGISLFTDVPLGKVGDRVHLTFYIAQEPAVNVAGAFPAADTEASASADTDASMGSRIELSSVIRSMTRSRLADEVAATTQYGVEFTGLRPDVRLALRDFVLDCRFAAL